LVHGKNFVVVVQPNVSRRDAVLLGTPFDMSKTTLDTCLEVLQRFATHHTGHGSVSIAVFVVTESIDDPAVILVKTIAIIVYWS
jgi:hypothetical protein